MSGGRGLVQIVSEAAGGAGAEKLGKTGRGSRPCIKSAWFCYSAMRDPPCLGFVDQHPARPWKRGGPRSVGKELRFGHNQE